MLSKNRTLPDSSSSSSHQCQSASSAETVANVDDLLTQILVCLPIKSLVKFKAVSKHWHSLISSPNFSLRLNLIPKPISALVLLSKYIPKFLCPKRPRTCTRYDCINLIADSSHNLFNIFTFSSDTIVLQSCKGLLLCGSFNWHDRNNRCFIFNPITKQRVYLPRLSDSFDFSPRRCRTIVGINLAFNPSKSPHYKVICVRNCDSMEEGLYQIEIFSSETKGRWRLSGGIFSTRYHTNFKDGVFWNGALHWISHLGTSLYFNVDDETLREMPMPRLLPIGWGTWRKCFYFGESRGHLHLIEFYGPCTTQFDVHEMQKDYSGWFVKYHVDLTMVIRAYPEMATSYYENDYQYSVLCIVREENDEDSYMVLHVPKKAICYKFKDETFKNLHEFAPLAVATGSDWNNELEYKSGWCDAFQYTQSLAYVF